MKKKRAPRVKEHPAQVRLFDAEALRQKTVGQMAGSYFNKLLRKGYDPAYFVQVEPDDLVTLADRLIGGFGNSCVVNISPGVAPVELEQSVYLTRRRCVVLSKGLEDQNRRIVAQDEDGWVIGLWIGLLRRQVRQGTINVKAWCFEALLDLDREGGYWQARADSWTKDLLRLETP